MKRLNLTKQTFTFLILFATLTLTVAFNCIAEEAPSTLSGRVIKANGEPIADSTVVLIYVRFGQFGGTYTLYNTNLYYPFLRKDLPEMEGLPKDELPDEQELRDAPPFLKAKTDSEGNFTITGIVPGKVQLLVLPDAVSKEVSSPQKSERWNYAPLPEIKAIKFGKVLFYPYFFLPSSPQAGAVTFAIQPDAAIQNVEIIMKSDHDKQQKISGRIIFKDGSPLANTSVLISRSRLGLDGTDGDSANLPLQTDANGDFMFTESETGIYALSVRHLGLSAFSELFVLNEKEYRQGLVLRFNGNPSDLAAPPPENAEKQDDRTYSGIYFSYDYRLYFPRVWVINPENGHAYKVIRCDWKREDAVAKAEVEDAHLVTVTSKEEQIWLDEVFGNLEYWLGLTHVALGNKWQWDTGEPLTYTNWTLKDVFKPDFPNLPPDIPRPPGFGGPKKDYAIMSNKGQWEAISQERGTRIAIIEKDGLRAKKPDPVE
ncbi:MAG: lectin-like protein [Candidatus Poribacteria bacterium]|nr:lectin-like protein [Candidatus Poribacteria bacterium]